MANDEDKIKTYEQKVISAKVCFACANKYNLYTTGMG